MSARPVDAQQMVVDDRIVWRHQTRHVIAVVHRTFGPIQLVDALLAGPTDERRWVVFDPATPVVRLAAPEPSPV